jgi:hypothetical protein
VCMRLLSRCYRYRGWGSRVMVANCRMSGIIRPAVPGHPSVAGAGGKCAAPGLSTCVCCCAEVPVWVGVSSDLARVSLELRWPVHASIACASLLIRWPVHVGLPVRTWQSGLPVLDRTWCLCNKYDTLLRGDARFVASRVAVHDKRPCL